MADNSAHLARAAAVRREATLARAQAAIAELDRAGTAVTFRSVAVRGGVSRSWLYREPVIRAEILRLRVAGPANPLPPAAQRATSESNRQRLDALRQELARLQAENRQLRDQLARRLGHERVSTT